MHHASRLMAFLLVTLLSAGAQAWDPGEVDELNAKAMEAKGEMLKDDPTMQRFFDSAHTYVIIPAVGKAGFGVGGARGKGLLYEGGEPTAIVTLTQLTVGFQAGAQAYSEFLFFRDASHTEDFKQGNYELGAQASAVAVRTGVSADANYTDGVAVFTRAKGGLMYEASVGGQKFSVKKPK